MGILLGCPLPITTLSHKGSPPRATPVLASFSSNCRFANPPLPMAACSLPTTSHLHVPNGRFLVAIPSGPSVEQHLLSTLSAIRKPTASQGRSISMQYPVFDITHITRYTRFAAPSRLSIRDRSTVFRLSVILGVFAMMINQPSVTVSWVEIRQLPPLHRL